MGMNGSVGGGLRVWVWGYGGISAVEKEGGRTVGRRGGEGRGGGSYEADVFFAPHSQAPGSPMRFRCWEGVLVSVGWGRRGRVLDNSAGYRIVCLWLLGKEDRRPS